VAASSILETARTLEGRPYMFGGADPSGFDCSGLVWYVFLQHHVLLPRTTLEQARMGLPIDAEAIEAGDLVFFATTSSEPSHVGIALDRRTLIHAPSTGTVVRIERFDTPYWKARLTGARRVAVAGL
jgi:cell wall-associated NlpC family hydrolase